MIRAKTDPIELKIGDHVIVHGREFVLTEAYFNLDKPPSIYFDSLEELMEKAEMPKMDWSSPLTKNQEFLARVGEMQTAGKTEQEIADAEGCSITQLRLQRTMAKREVLGK